MNIVGDLRYANKFCINTKEKGIIWVPSIETAKQYVSDPKNKDWYNKTIIASYEQVVKAYDGKFYFKSEAPEKPVEREIIDALETFKQQSRKKIKRDLQLYAEKNGFDSFVELISFANSSIEKYNTMALKAVEYRDRIYAYTDRFFSDLNEKEIGSKEDIAFVYDDYLKNFPFN